MTWTYRIVKDENGGHRIAEVHGDPNDRPVWTVDPMYPWGDDLAELQMDMRHMMSAFDKPVLDEATLSKRLARQTD